MAKLMIPESEYDGISKIKKREKLISPEYNELTKKQIRE